jgi:hypothetical protein
MQAATSPKLQSYSPVFSPEHGGYVALAISFLIGTVASGTWTLATVLALVCAFFAFQAEHPFAVQLKQRRHLKPRLLIWGSLYAVFAGAIAVYLGLQSPVLWWVYFGAILAAISDSIAIVIRQRRSLLSEAIAFAAICLSAPLAHGATVGTIPIEIWGLWGLTSLFFASSIFTVKLRKPKHPAEVWVITYHAIATVLITALFSTNILPLAANLAFGVAWFKLAIVLIWKTWYRTAQIRYIALLETSIAVLFGAIVCLSIADLSLW